MFIQQFSGSDIKRSRVPKVKDILKAKMKKISQDLIYFLNDEIDEKFYNWAKSLLQENDPTEVLATTLFYCFEEELNPDAYNELQGTGPKGKQLDQQGKSRLFVALGKKDKLNARKLVELIMSKVSIKSKQISDVQVLDKFSFITVPFEKHE